MANSTNISELPTTHVKTSDSELAPQHAGRRTGQPDQPQPNSLDQTTISQLITGIQQAATLGLTSLASNHIPTNETIASHSMDPVASTPNYVPPAQECTDYIQTHNMSDLINAYSKKDESQTTADSLFTEFRIPILMAIMYFMFQHPVFKKWLFFYLPGLFFENDNVYTAKGMCVASILFGGLYYLIELVIKMFTTF